MGKIKMKCENCDRPTIRIQPLYDVPICQKCRSLKIVKEKYPYITKTTAISKYKVNEDDLLNVPFLEVDNPHYKIASPMKLYRPKDIEAISKNKHNGVAMLNNTSTDANNLVSYFLIGSKYDENNDFDMLPLMEQYNVVCTGFAWDHDLIKLYRSNEKDIINELKSKGEIPKSYNALKLFLQMKPGDIVAIKSSGNPKGGKAFLEIVAYAVVVERNGLVYWHDSRVFGHCINVQFIRTDIKQQFELGGYGRTIHYITDKYLVDKLFNGYKNADACYVRDRIKVKRRNRKATIEKDTSLQIRKGSDGYVTNQKHNKIQQKFKERLESIYGEENVQLEENNIDIRLLQTESITLYEVKPYDFAEDCIKSGLGQLLSYVYFDTDERKKKIRIVGPYPPDEEEKQFIAFLKTTLNADFDYEWFHID